MITNTSDSKVPASGEFLDAKKYYGVASVNVVAINPSNAKLRSFGWNIPEDAQEPKYVTTGNDGTPSARVRFMVQIQDLEDKPIIPLDFWIKKDLAFTKDRSKVRIIDSFGRSAFATKEEATSHRIPMYSNGPASINGNYKVAHVGECELVAFLMKYLNITPVQTFLNGKFVDSKNPGELTIDNWDALCKGDVSEIASYIAYRPKNCVKVILGIQTTDDNKAYQTFLKTTFIGNGASPDRNTGEYTSAKKAIDKVFDQRPDSPLIFTPAPVRLWGNTATEVKEQSVENMPNVGNDSFEVADDGDLPF